MGAAVLMRAAALGRRWFDRLVLCAPMIRLSSVPLLPVVPGLVRAMRVAGLGNAFVPGGNWLAPTSILTPRLLRFSAELSF